MYIPLKSIYLYFYNLFAWYSVKIEMLLNGHDFIEMRDYDNRS